VDLPTSPGSYWLDRDPRPSRPALAGAERAEVGIVGGGVAGTFVALLLAEAGVSTVLLEADRLARGASGRNAGFLLADGAETFAEIARDRGRDVAVALRTAGLLTRDQVARIAQDEDVSLRMRGSLRLAEDPAELADFVATAEALGAPLRALGESDLPDAYRGKGFVGGLVDPGDGEMDPLRLVRAVARRAEAEGATIHEGTRVRRIEETRSGVRILAEGGVLDVERAVVAANAWSKELLPDGPTIRPVRGQMLAARASPAPEWDVPVYARRGADYWRRLADGTLLVGGMRRAGGETEETDDARPTPTVQSRLDEMLAALVPPGARVEVKARWAGTMDFSADGCPRAGLAPNRRRTHVLGGFTGHGMGWGPGVAGLLVDALLGRGAGIPAPFSPSTPSRVA
jgi:glycine/D-amino acid oxidase-like deaminating enzyme